jgi:hypothetical protein
VLGDLGRGALLAVRQFRVLVEVAAPRDQLGLFGLRCRGDFGPLRGLGVGGERAQREGRIARRRMDGSGMKASMLPPKPRHTVRNLAESPQSRGYRDASDVS